jgi:hypothetical protein
VNAEAANESSALAEADGASDGTARADAAADETDAGKESATARPPVGGAQEEPDPDKASGPEEPSVTADSSGATGDGEASVAAGGGTEGVGDRPLAIQGAAASAVGAGEPLPDGAAASGDDPAAPAKVAGADSGSAAPAVEASLPDQAVSIGGGTVEATAATAAGAVADVPAPVVVGAGGAEPAAATAAEDAADVNMPLSVSAAEVEANTLYVAGEAPAGALVRIYADEELVGEAKASDTGTWLLEAKQDVPLGEVTIRADATAPGGDSPVAAVERPFVRYADSIVLEPAVTAMAESAAAQTVKVPSAAYIIIRRGDNLWRISRRNYGRGIKYHAIFNANRNLIQDPDLIYPGQIFVVPTRDVTWEASEAS